MATSKFGFTLPQVENEVFKCHLLLALSPRPNPHRPTHLLQLALLLTMRYALSRKKDDYDKSITHLTEAVLLPFQSKQDVAYLLFELATVLISRFNLSGQPEDIKSSVKYLRYLRINFHFLGTFDIPHGRLTSRLVQALAGNSELGSWDMVQDMEEMSALAHELLSSDVSTNDSTSAFISFSEAVRMAVIRTLSPENANLKLPLEQVIQVLRGAEMIITDLRVSCALALCLTHRFMKAHVVNDYEEAITIADKIVAAHSPGDSLTPTQSNAIELIKMLVASRLNLNPSPEYLEDATHRFRTLLGLPSLPDHVRSDLAAALDFYARQRFSYFGVAGNSGETPSKIDPYFPVYYYVEESVLRQSWGIGPEDHQRKAYHLGEIIATIKNDETTDVEAAVERGRALLLSPDHQFSYVLTVFFAAILFYAHQRTNRLDYLNEAITAYRDIRKVPGVKKVHYLAANGLLYSLKARFSLFRRRQDIEEVMQLYPILVNDECAEVFRRFNLSCGWAHDARLLVDPSNLTAYERAMTLMQETLVFSPTLQTQHYRLVDALSQSEGLPSDYASYQIEGNRHKQAIQTLERGRALLWSEMRGLRTSTDQLRAADPALADKFAAINRRLESVTMSVAQSEGEDTSDRGTGTRRHEGTDSIGHLVTTQRRLLEERETLISDIQSLPGFENFLKPPSFDALNSAAARGPVIIINQSRFRSHIVILLKYSSPSVIFTPSDFHDRANRLKGQLLRVRNERGLDSVDYDLTLASVLADLYELVGKPVIERLRQLNVPEKSRVWWCPTSAFCSLPLHAMGPIGVSDNGDKLYFMDLYIPSYTPTLTALIESRKPGSQPEAVDKPPLLLAAQPETLFGAWDEIEAIKAVRTPVTTLVSENATPTTVVASLRDHRFVHFVCHGLLETGKPFDASFELHGDNLTLLEIVRSQLPAAEFAFLSACHTAELTEDSIADEGLHLTAAMQFCGFRSVVGTMWAMADTDGADLSENFYKSIFLKSTGRKRVQYYERSARALHSAVKKLRKKRGITLERWVNFVHYGA
ncbi:CHAT domain-containing protein [Lactarius psammicola]|nr:CHAT domain-containing protein [Lactarius psammicola]